MLCVEMVLRFVRLNTSWASPDVVDSTEFLGTFGYPSVTELLFYCHSRENGNPNNGILVFELKGAYKTSEIHLRPFLFDCSFQEILLFNTKQPIYKPYSSYTGYFCKINISLICLKNHVLPLMYW